MTSRTCCECERSAPRVRNTKTTVVIGIVYAILFTDLIEARSQVSSTNHAR